MAKEHWWLRMRREAMFEAFDKVNEFAIQNTGFEMADADTHVLRVRLTYVDDWNLIEKAEKSEKVRKKVPEKFKTEEVELSVHDLHNGERDWNAQIADLIRELFDKVGGVMPISTAVDVVQTKFPQPEPVAEEPEPLPNMSPTARKILRDNGII